jgi:hypothetical protein
LIQGHAAIFNFTSTTFHNIKTSQIDAKLYEFVSAGQLSIQVHTLELLLNHLDESILLGLNLLSLPCFGSIHVGIVFVVVVSQVHLSHLLIQCSVSDLVRVRLQICKNPSGEVSGTAATTAKLSLEIVNV